MTNTLLNLFNFNLFPTPEPTVDRPPESSTQVPEPDTSFERQIFDTVNQHRTSLKLPPLRLVPEISDIAREHSRWLCDTDYWEGKVGHAGSDDRAKKVRKLGLVEISENLATAQVSEYRYRTVENRRSTADIILAHWIASTEGHRESIEERGSTHTGIGVFSRPVFDEDGNSGFIIYVTQLFGR